MENIEEIYDNNFDKKDLKIGLSLSGGGIRAATFHLGVLYRLAQENLLEKITVMSTVSGGSIITSLIYSLSGNKWPESRTFINDVFPNVKEYIINKSLQRDGIIRMIRNPHLAFDKRAECISRSLKKFWNINCNIEDIPENPIWIINTTCYESGKNWTFRNGRFGDYVIGYTYNPKFPLSKAVAASAAYPGGIGPLTLKTKNYKWFKYGTNKEKNNIDPSLEELHLWDGGVYDNLGTEPLFKKGKVIDKINFLIISDASKKLKIKKKQIFFKRAMRLLDITMDQVRSLRSRQVVEYFEKTGDSGVYLKIGNTVKYILESSYNEKKHGCIDDLLEKNSSNHNLSQKDVNYVADFKTRLRKLKDTDFEKIFRHGWEVANTTLCSYCGNIFEWQEYNKEKSESII